MGDTQSSSLNRPSDRLAMSRAAVNAVVVVTQSTTVVTITGNNVF